MAYDRSSSAWGFGSTPGHMMERSARRQDAFARGRYGMEAPALINMAPFKRKQRDDSAEELTHIAERHANSRRVLLRGLKRMRVSGSPPASPENDSSSTSSEDDIEMMDQINNSAISQAERAKALVLAQRRPTTIVKPQQQQQQTTGSWPPAQFFAAGNAMNIGPIPDDTSCRAMVVFDPRLSVAPSTRVELVTSDDEADRSSDDEAPFVRFEEIHEDEDMAMDVD